MNNRVLHQHQFSARSWFTAAKGNPSCQRQCTLRRRGCTWPMPVLIQLTFCVLLLLLLLLCRRCLVGVLWLVVVVAICNR